MTVVRVWRGYGTSDGVQRYCRDHFAGSVLGRLRKLDGFVDACVLVHSGDGETEVVVATLWRSLDAIRAFAGEHYEVAVVEPVVRELLHRFEDRVRHYDVAFARGD